MGNLFESNMNLPDGQKGLRRNSAEGHLTAGAILRKCRIEQKISLEQAAQYLCLSTQTLEAIETGNHASLPPPAFAIGFVTSYAEYLGIENPKALAAQFRTELSATLPKEDKPLVQQKPPKSFNTRLVFFWTLAALVIVAYIIWYASLNTNKVEGAPSIEQTVSEGSEASAIADVQSPETLPGTNARKNSALGTIVIKALNDSWIEIRTESGSVLASKVLRTGEEYQVPAKPTGLKLITGNAGGLLFIVNGEEFVSSKKRGRVIRDLPLDAAAISKLLTPKETQPQQLSE